MNLGTTSQESEVLSRIIGPENPSFSQEPAKSILALRFSDADVERMNGLAAAARERMLSEEEESQLHAYLFVGAVVDLMHSKARLSLQRHAADPDFIRGTTGGATIFSGREPCSRQGPPSTGRPSPS